MQHGFIASGIDLEHGPDADRAAKVRCAVEVALSIPDYSRFGRPAVIGAREIVKDSFFTCRVNFEYCSCERRATLGRSAVKVAFCIQNHTGNGFTAISRTGKTVQNRFRAAWVEFEHRPGVAGAAVASRAVKVASGVADYACLRKAISVISSEAIQNGLLARCS